MADMYHLDFSQRGIDRICVRDGDGDNSATYDIRIATSAPRLDKDKEQLLSLMCDYDAKAWRPWLRGSGASAGSPSPHTSSSSSSPFGGGGGGGGVPSASRGGSSCLLELHSSGGRRTSAAAVKDFSERSLWKNVGLIVFVF